MLAFYFRELVTHVVFFALVCGGWWQGQLGGRAAAILLALWTVGIVASASWPGGHYWFLAAVAVADVLLILKIVGRDIRI